MKESIRHTATEFMKMMPTFVRRVAQREYDFILLSPLKRRMLLKMYCIGKLEIDTKNSIESLTKAKKFHLQHDVCSDLAKSFT